MFAESMTVGDAVGWGASILDESENGGRHTRQDATLLLRHVLNLSLAELLAERERPLTPQQATLFHQLIRERAKGKPIQYITGQQEFFGLPFRVTPDVLIPRPETEHLVEAAIERLRDIKSPQIVDVGTGSGCIAVSLAHALPQAQVTAVDSSLAALKIAQENARTNGVAARIQFLESDLLSFAVGEVFDAIVSNPPYIALSEKKSLAVEVRDFEPAQALFSGKTGMEIYERLIPQAHSALMPCGWLLLEIGHRQRDAVASFLRGWDEVEFIPDLQAIPRVAVARKHHAGK